MVEHCAKSRDVLNFARALGKLESSAVKRPTQDNAFSSTEAARGLRTPKNREEKSNRLSSAKT